MCVRVPLDRYSFQENLRTFITSRFDYVSVFFALQYQMLPSGEKESSGSLLSLANVSRHDSGTYICEAANGVDNPVRAKIDLRIICKKFIVLLTILVDKLYFLL